MAYIEGTDRSQALLLPEAVDDYVEADNPVRFIDAFVDGLDLEAAGFVRAQAKATGRPGYHPGDLLKLYVYGYLNRIRSSRRLEAETHRNIEVIWLLRRLRPDFKTIADFRRDNREAFRKVFRQFVLLCRELDLFGRELIAVDGSRIKAVNSRDRNFSKAKIDRALAESDTRLTRYLKQLDESDKDDDGGPGGASADRLQEKIAKLKEHQDRLHGYRKELEQSGRDQLSLTDPDARAMHPSSRVGVGYNVQIAVDDKHKLIAEQQVHTKVSDLGLLAETALAAQEVLGTEGIDLVADKGYFAIEDIEACEAADITAYVPKPQRGPAIRDGFFAKEQFRFDAKANSYTCPGGHALKAMHRRKIRDTAFVITYGDRKVCKGCNLKARCTNSSFRTIARYEGEAVLERMAERLAAHPDILDRRREIVEHPFGSIKQWMGQGAFLMRGLNNVRAEFSLTALVYNLRRAITLVGVPSLLAAIKG
ncbi:MAG: IS1182 family transposase [Pseudomonadota bacterium]